MSDQPTPPRGKTATPRWQEVLKSSNAWNAHIDGIPGVELTDDGVTAPPGTPNAETLAHIVRTVLDTHGFKVTGGTVPSLNLKVRE